MVREPLSLRLQYNAGGGLLFNLVYRDPDSPGDSVVFGGPNGGSWGISLYPSESGAGAFVLRQPQFFLPTPEPGTLSLAAIALLALVLANSLRLGGTFMQIQKLAMLAALCAGAAVAGTPPGMPAGWSDGYVYANGIRIHYYHAAPAPGKSVMVMAHGFSDYGLNWTTLTLDLQKDYDIYMVDARGHGYTDPPVRGQKGDVAVEDLVGFLREMKIEKPILMGHSMGAATVMRLGATYPDLAKAVIMLDPGLGVPGTGRRPPATRPEPSEVIAGLIARNNTPYDDLVAQCHKHTPMWDQLDCEYWAVSKHIFHGTYPTGAERGAGGFRRGNNAETLSKITAPALILKADAPPDVRAANIEAAKALPNGKLVHIDGAEHNLHHDKRKRTVEVLTEFLSSL